MTNNPISSGTPVIVVLHSPREKCWGVIEEINSSGVFFRGLDLNAFDDWVTSVIHNEPFLGLADHFFPMWRVERITRDEPTPTVPALYEQVEQRSGRNLEDLFKRDVIN